MDWIADVDYWKRSSPHGTVIDDMGEGKYRIHSDAMDVFFGVEKSRKLLYITSEEEVADNCTKDAKKTIDSEIKAMTVGKKLAIIVNINSLLKVFDVNMGAGVALSMLGGIDTIVVTEK